MAPFEAPPGARAHKRTSSYQAYHEPRTLAPPAMAPSVGGRFPSEQQNPNPETGCLLLDLLRTVGSERSGRMRSDAWRLEPLLSNWYEFNHECPTACIRCEECLKRGRKFPMSLAGTVHIF